MKYIPVYTVILTIFVLAVAIGFRGKETVQQGATQVTYGIPNVVVETENGFLRVEKQGNTYNIK
jgi:hypothetical protein